MRTTYRRALGSALLLTAAAAQAQVANSVQIYGLLVPMVDRIRVSGASADAPAAPPSMLGPASYTGAGNNTTNRMHAATTHIGFRGNEDLGGGLAAIFQLESGLQLDEGTLTGGPAGASRFFNRNSQVGLRGAFGTLFGGIWDTPSAWSHLGLTNGIRNPYTGDSSSIFVTPGFNIPHSVVLDTRVNSPADAVFNRRQGNSIQYWSPKFGSFSARLAYSFPEGAKIAANGISYNPRVIGLGAEYAGGPLLVRYVFQQHDDYFGLAWIGPNPAANPDVPGSTANDSTDRNHRLLARYSFSPMWALQATFDRLTYSADGVAAGALNRYRRNAYALLLLFKAGVHTAWTSAGVAQDGSCSISGGGACNTSDLGARSWGIGYRYDFSRRTDLWASLYGVHNRANGQYGVFPRPSTGIAPGAKSVGLTLGIEHSF